ncbi:Glycosyltransferase involved in cell wall bisynthesis [Desulfotomaculum arcticum]|uniref:Glycosyltransferase involved in cell wall bisynthesis n=1 Tax=Desulfotruncus arcticus DSM 17038 TaxID=1121424 RepID=A0A1I2X3J3_9FIRM|nr:glycosyltransferase family 4 protein [Desulfotruncus arcticus]SFH07597.1 Glycosyltransferase involved in cell wall bisynthesis [Desulfotomaculum arcticum] [Desulfotruncus arcticus DSM 17038]
MQGVFVHDHKFPRYGEAYYHSYGFDNEFFNRYLNIFDKFDIIARETKIDFEEAIKTPTVNEKVDFISISNYVQLKSSFIRDNIDRKINESDCVIVRLPSILGLYAIRSAKKHNKPYLIEVVGCPWDAFWQQNIYKKLIAPIITILCKKAIYDAGYVVYVTEDYLQNKYPTLGSSISCSNVTLPSVDEINLRKRIEKIKKLDSNKNVIIGTCSTVDALYKGQQYMIEAIARLKSKGYKIEYQLVGGGDPSFLKSIAKKFGVEDDVRFLGKLKHADVFTWLDQIDIYVQPSRTEGLPRSVIEAMSRGCPVFGSNAGGIPELIDNEFVFKKGNVDGICNVYKKFTYEVMKNHALLNYKNSKKYLQSVLYERRISFFKEFIKGAVLKEKEVKE